MSGHPDGAVEAMARAMRDMPRGFQISDSTYRRWAEVAFAALPAGLWHSDGQGRVEPLEGAIIALARRTAYHLHNLPVTTELDDVRLAEEWDAVAAALSATDTEDVGYSLTEAVDAIAALLKARAARAAPSATDTEN